MPAKLKSRHELLQLAQSIAVGRRYSAPARLRAIELLIREAPRETGMGEDRVRELLAAISPLEPQKRPAGKVRTPPAGQPDHA